MAITPTFDKNIINKQFTLFLERYEKNVLFSLTQLGEDCRNHLIKTREYTDRTANLKSSSGYAVIKNGKIVKSVFEASTGKKGLAVEGQTTGQNLVATLARNYRNSYALVVVAGMNYAVHVQKSGRNVLGQTEAFAKGELNSIKEQIIKSLTSFK